METIINVAGASILVAFVSLPASLPGALAFGLGARLGGSKTGMLAGGAVGLVLGWVPVIWLAIAIERQNPGGTGMMEVLAVPVVALAIFIGVVTGAVVGRWFGRRCHRPTAT